MQAARKPPRDIAPVLDGIGGGGGTPLRRALQLASKRLGQLSRRQPGQIRRLVVLTDARSRDALAGIADNLTVAWRWIAAEQRFAYWRPDLHVSDRTGALLGRGDAFLLGMSAPTELWQPIGLLPTIVGKELVSQSLLRIIERDIQAAETLLTGRFQTPIDQSRVTLNLVKDRPQDPATADPCCPEPEAWVARWWNSETDYRYEITIPASYWLGGSWISPDTERGGGFTTLLHEYFHVLQYELAQQQFDQVPQWSIEGTAIWLTYDLGLALDHGFLLELWSNQLEIGSTFNPYPQGHYLGEAYVSQLVKETDPDSYFEFWRQLSEIRPEHAAWKRAFASVFGITADEFTRTTHQKREESFAELSGRLRGPGASGDIPLSVGAYTNLPISLIYHPGEVNSGGDYKVQVPRRYPYKVRIGAPRTSCAVFVGEDHRFVSRENAVSFTHDEPTAAGPTIHLPESFCQEEIAIRLQGDAHHVPAGLELEACSRDGELCVEMFADRGGIYRASVPIPGLHTVEVTSDEHVCKSFLAADGITIQRDQALLVESALSPPVQTLRIDASSEFCSVTIRGQFTGRSAEWLEGRAMRAYRSEGGSPFYTNVNNDGSFELPVSGPGEYEFSLLGAIRHQGELLPCSISSGMSGQWLSRVSNTPINRALVTVESDVVTDLQWEISPDACRYIVTGRIRTTAGDSVANMSFQICPGPGSGGGYCKEATSDQEGRFRFLAPYVGEVEITASHRQPRGGSCEWESTHASRQQFTIRPTDSNHLDWIIPPDTCS